MLSPQIDHSIDSVKIGNNKAEKGRSYIAEAREADGITRNASYAVCVCELRSTKATGQESRPMKTGYARTPRRLHTTSRPQMQMPNKAVFPWRTQAGGQQCFDQHHLLLLKPLQRPHSSSRRVHLPVQIAC